MDWNLLEEDRELFERELATFVPPRLFDAHAHLYEKRQFLGELPALVQKGPDSVGWDPYQEFMTQLLPQRRISGLFFGWPVVGLDTIVANGFVASEARRNSSSRALMLVQPGMDPDFIRETVRRQGMIGLKCYHCYASERPTFEASIPSYLPEKQVKVAHEEGLTIMLHMVKRRGIADSSNQEVIGAWAKRYPNARLILAHAARGFNPHHVIQGIGALRGLRNVWCDTSAVTESGGFEAIARTLGVDRLLYGSDFPVTHIRGRCVTLGDSFFWLSPDNSNLRTSYDEIRPTLVGLESLRALKLASLNLGLSDSQIEGIFFNNARQLFDLAPC
ncbi:MAG: amidohydrolase family protein [Terriglobia bacterium]